MRAATLPSAQDPGSDQRIAVDRVALFRGVESSVAHDAVRDCDVQTLAAGSLLLRPGEANDTLYVLLSGQLAAYLDTGPLRGVPIPIGIGETVGEMSAIDGKPVSALVVAVTEASVLRLPGPLFWSHIAGIPGVTRNLLASLSERMRRANGAMLEAQRKQLELEHLRRELDVARELQMSMVPARGRLFPHRRDVDIAGMMNPASDVGGDFFDAFFVDDAHAFLCIGDVSGHGIAAALFMARALGLVRMVAMDTREPGRLLERINEQLCAGNDTNIFVTLFCAFLHVASGRLVYANAGHCAPLVAHGGRAFPLPLPKGALIGAMPGRAYASKEAGLDPGVALVCFTDGIPEAESDGHEFSGERLLSVVAAHADRSVEDLVASVQRELCEFLGDTPPADDCTLLAVRRPAVR